jgi:beta-barrel assembly-enhancing protease
MWSCLSCLRHVRRVYNRIDGSRAAPHDAFMTQKTVTAILLLCAAVALAADGRTLFKPGWNMYSAQQDVEVGQQTSVEAERQLPMMNNARIDAYVNALGLKLAAKAQGGKYPYTFKVVNDRAINAFALPGGPVYINRGVIEAAASEGQLAGVIAHEISHVALRHGTSQASKASAAQMPLGILGGLIGSSSTTSAIAQLGAGFAVNSVLLKHSRTAETQADVMGTQMLFDAGYDPRAMAQFFQTLEAQEKGSGSVEFFSNHPSPVNRIARINQEITALGGAPRNAVTTSRAFSDTRRTVLGLAGPSGEGAGAAAGASSTIPRASAGRFVAFEHSLVHIEHPASWQAYGQGDALTLTPKGGLVNDGNGQQALVYGVIVNLYEPHAEVAYNTRLRGRRAGQPPVQTAATRLEAATDELVQELRLTNRNMQITQGHESISVAGGRGLSTYMSNDSPSGGREINWLVTATHPDGVLFIVFTAPERDFERDERVFSQVLRSVRITP